MKMVKLEQICIDGGTQCRVVLNQQKIYEYKERMEEGIDFPALQTVFDGTTHWLTDGFHRYHAYRLLGVKAVDVEYKPGTHDEAVLEALKANGKHGLSLTNEDKRNKVLMAIALPGYADKSNYEIAKLCELSQPFVASVRDAKAKERQDSNRQKSAEKKAGNTNPISIEPTTTNPISSEPNPYEGATPDADEIEAAELAQQADMKAMYDLLESSDPLKHAHEEIKRLNLQHAQLELRMKGLMNERDEAIKMVKKLQKELDKLKGKK